MEPSDHILNEVAGGRLRVADADVGRSRERNRQRRLLTIAFILAVPALWLWFRILTGRAVDLTSLSLPTVDPFLLIVGIFFVVLIGTLLGIKPLIEVKQGKVNAIARIRGEKNIIKTLLEHFQNAKPDLSYGVSFGNSDAFEQMQTTIKAFEPVLQGVDIYTSDLGAVIGTHTGPGVVGIGFIV